MKSLTLSNSLVIDGFAVPCRGRSDAKNEKDRQEEDLYINAIYTLEDCRNCLPRGLCEKHKLDTFQRCMMFALPHVAKFYAVDRQTLLDAWVKQFFSAILTGVMR